MCVPKSIRDPGLQVLPGQNRPHLWGGYHRHRRPQRLRQIQHLRRHPLGHGGAVHPRPPGRQNGGRDLRRHRKAPADRLCRGFPGAGQHGPDVRYGRERGDGHPPVLPLRRERILYQPPQCAPQGRERAIHGHRPGPGGLRHHRPGQDRRNFIHQKRRPPGNF